MAFFVIDDKCSDNLQLQTMHLSAATKQIHTLVAFIVEKRDEYDKYEQSTTTTLFGCEVPTYSIIRKRKIFADEIVENKVEFDGRSPTVSAEKGFSVYVKNVKTSSLRK